MANAQQLASAKGNDVSRAYFSAPARRQVFVELCSEETLARENMVGEPVDPPWEMSRDNVIFDFMPMAPRDTVKAIQEHGVPKGLALGLTALFGMGLNTYDVNKKEDAGHGRPRRRRERRPVRGRR